MRTLAVFVLLALAAGTVELGAASSRWVPRRGPATGQRWAPAAATPQRGVSEVSLVLDLLGAAVSAGLPLTRALGLVGEVATPSLRDGLARVVAGLELGASWERAWSGAQAAAGREGERALREVRAALTFAALTGAPAAPLLYARSRAQRRQAQRAAERRAAELGVRLVLPLGLCSLPAFLCLGVVPVVVSLLPSW